MGHVRFVPPVGHSGLTDGKCRFLSLEAGGVDSPGGLGSVSQQLAGKAMGQGESS